MTLEKIEELWEKDSNIDEFNLDNESLKIPQLHQRYMVFYNQFSLMLSDAETKLNRLRKQKFEFYSGKKSYDGEMFDLKVLKGDLHLYLDSDPDIAKQIQKIDYLKTCINYLEGILKQVNNRTYHIKNAIEVKRFEFGA